MVVSTAASTISPVMCRISRKYTRPPSTTASSAATAMAVSGWPEKSEAVA